MFDFTKTGGINNEVVGVNIEIRQVNNFQMIHTWMLHECGTPKRISTFVYIDSTIMILDDYLNAHA